MLCVLTLSAASADEAALASLDGRSYRAFPDAFGALAASRLSRDESGLIGRNRAWGELFSPRFQLGAGSALRTALAAERPRDAASAFRAIEVGALSARPDGLLPSRLPPSVGGPPSAADSASVAAFFLGDACLGVRAFDALAVAAPWLAARIDDAGRIDSSGNTRTCWSGETVFGTRKRVAVPEVFVGLAYAAARTGEPAVSEAAQRLRQWAERNPDADPCYRG